MGTTILMAHSGLRYLVLLAGVAALVAALLGLRGGEQGGTRAERALMMGFVGLVDVQLLLGIVLVLMIPFYGALIGHIVMMVSVAVVAHAGSVIAKRRDTHRSGASVRAITAATALLLIAGGIMAIGRPLL